MGKTREIATRLRNADRDPKMRGLSPAARLMHLTAIVYCVEMGTNGLIPRDFPRWFHQELASVDEDPRQLAARVIQRAQAEADRQAPEQVT
jgi:hypothetical protein